MIFVTVGNVTQHFRRLLEAIEEMAVGGILNQQPVIIQTGSNSYFASSHCVQRDFFPPDEYRQLIHDAEVVVCHGGAGTLHHVFQTGKVPVVMPRRRKYGEHVDDQYSLVKALADQGRIVAAFEPEDLTGAILKAKSAEQRTIPAEPAQALALVSNAIGSLMMTSVDAAQPQ